MWPFNKRQKKPQEPTMDQILRELDQNCTRLRARMEARREVEKAHQREIMRTTLQKAVLFFKRNYPNARLTVRRNPLRNEAYPITLPVMVYFDTKTRHVQIECADTGSVVVLCDLPSWSDSELSSTGISYGYTEEEFDEELATLIAEGFV